MKKQRVAPISPKLKKEKVANLNRMKGKGIDPPSDASHCCTKFPMCLLTITTRPDSLNAAHGQDANNI